MAGPDKTPRHGQISGQRIGRPAAPGSKEWKYEGQHDDARHDPHPPPKSAKTDRGRGIQPFKRPGEASGHPLSVGLIASYLRATLADKTSCAPNTAQSGLFVYLAQFLRLPANRPTRSGSIDRKSV